MKVLHYIPSLDRTSGGTTAYMQLLARELGKLTKLHVVTHISENPVTISECQIHYIEGMKHPFRMKKQWKELLDALRPDVVHINCCWMPACALTQKWAQKMGYKVVLSPHGMLEPWIVARHYWSRKVPALLLYQRKAVKMADYLHATAESEKNNLLKLGYNDRIKIIPNGVDVEHIPMKSSWERHKKILFLSRVHVKKGINFLIEAVAALKNELEGYSVIIAGEGDSDYITELKSTAEHLGVSDIIQFIGGVYGDKKWDLFRNADLFVLPTHSENFGIVVAEALSCGTPVITTKGTPWQELETHQCGWWTDIGTAATTDAIRDFLSLTENDLQTMGKNGRMLIEKNYSARKMALDMVELYHTL